MFTENYLPFEGVLAADPVEEECALISLSIRYTNYSLSISDTQVEGKYSF